MRVDHRLLRAGVFLVLLGVPALLVQLGALDPDALGIAPRLWPVILIAIGFGLLLRLTPLASLGGILVAATLGLLAGTAIASGGSFLGGCTGGGGDQIAGTSTDQAGTFTGDAAQVRLEIDCGDLVVSTRAGSEWNVRTDGERRRPANVRWTGTELTVRSREGGRSIFDLGTVDRRERWDVALPTGPRTNLEAEVNAATARLDLGGARLGAVALDLIAANGSIDLSGATIDRLELSANAGNVGLRLGPGANLSGVIEINAGNLALCVPSGVGLEIVATEALASNDFAARGLARNGDTWRSADFDSAPSRVRLRVGINAGSASLDPAGGCDG